jgi:hypothetical protein
MNYDEKATVSIDAEGNVLKCAKGADVGACGYVKGAELCAKCGAMPVEMKMVPADELLAKEMMTEAMPKKKPAMPAEAVGVMKPDMEAMPEDEDMMAEDEEEMPEDEEMMGKKTKKMKPGKMPAAGQVVMMEDSEMESEEDYMDEEEKMPMKRTMGKAAMPKIEIEMEDDEEEGDEEGGDTDEAEEAMAEEDTMEEDDTMEDDEEMDEEEEDDEEMDMMGEKSFSSRDPEWEQIRRSRIKSLGIKTADLGAHGYLCAIERKAYAGSSPVCDDCPGGCVSEKGLPGLLHVEGLAEKMFEGFVIDSGYSQDADMFVVDVQTKDGSVKEVFIDGTSAEVLGFQKLDASDFEQKSDFAEYKLIDFTEAAEIAIKSIDGHVVAVEPDVFEGFDAYAVEIEGFDGKSYDVFVALDGEVLGYDKYEADEVEQIEAEAAELAIKRAFSEERRMELAKEGMALPDGSYPIVSEADLRNAIQAFGRAKDKEAAKRHIMKRARALKLESLIPGNWLAGSKEKSEELNDAEFMAALVEFQLLEDSIEDN